MFQLGKAVIPACARPISDHDEWRGRRFESPWGALDAVTLMLSPINPNHSDLEAMPVNKLSAVDLAYA